MKSFPLRTIQQTGRFLGQLEKWALVALVAVLVGFSLLQIVLRNFLATGFVWGDTLSRHIVLWVAFLGASRATAANKHIRIDLLPRLFPLKGSAVAAFIDNTFSLLVCAVLCYASWNFVQDERAAGGLAFADIPIWWLETIFPLSFAVMAIRFGCRLCDDPGQGAGREEGMGP